ncbi:terminase large subunit, partial [Holzapfeliella sp. He02]
MSKHFDTALKFAKDTVAGKRSANVEQKQASQRFLNDLKRTDEFDLRMDQADFVINLIHTTIVHQQGEDLNGNPLPGTPFILQPWEIFCVVNILLFFHKGTNLRRFHEALILIPRKNGKTAFSAAFGWALSILESGSGSKLYILANSLKQTMESFSFLQYNIDKFNDKSFKVRNNNAEHSISRKVGDGSIYIQALASDEKRLDSLNANLLILDELHTFRSSKKYILMKNAQKAYRNKLLIGISTAGDVPNGFLAQRLKYVQRILDRTIKADDYFVFVAKADQDEKGDVPDFTNPDVLAAANPSVGVSVSIDDLVEDALLAQNDPQTRLEFFNKTLNVFTASSNAYFDLNEFRASDDSYDWSLDDLRKMDIEWYGGADLSKLHDLTAAALYGRYGDV